jgi:hypothetical protein
VWKIKGSDDGVNHNHCVYGLCPLSGLLYNLKTQHFGSGYVFVLGEGRETPTGPVFEVSSF